MGGEGVPCFNPKLLSWGALAFAGLVAATPWLFDSTFGDAAKKRSTSVVKTASDIPPEIQEVLQQADAPTHTEPTPWGLYVINPVINGEGVLNPQVSPWPDLAGNLVTFEGNDALVMLEREGLPVVLVSEAHLGSMNVTAAMSGQHGENWSFRAYYSTPEGSQGYRSLEVDAFTPKEAMVFDEFPGNAIRDFRKSFEVGGYPTLIVVPDEDTASPLGERVVAWSQDGVAYQLRTTGLFTGDEVINLAREISGTASGGVE